MKNNSGYIEKIINPKKVCTTCLLIKLLIDFTLSFASVPSEQKKIFHPHCKGFLHSKMTSLKSIWGNYDLVPVDVNKDWPEYLIASLVFSLDGKKVLSGHATPLTGSKRGGKLKLWDSMTGQEICSLDGHTRPINSVALSPDGLFGVSASDDGTVRLWDVLKCKEIKVLKRVASKYPIAMAVNFSPINNEIIVGINEKPSLMLIDSKTGEEKKTYNIDWNIRKAVFSPDGKHILSISTYDEPCLWDVESGGLIRKFYKQNKLWSYLFSSAGAWICGGFSPDNNFVLCGSSDGKLRLWETISGKEIWSILAHKKSINDVAFSPDGKFIISTGNDASIKIINTLTGDIIDKIFLISSHDIGKSLAFSPDSKYFLVGTIRGVILQFYFK